MIMTKTTIFALGVKSEVKQEKSSFNEELFAIVNKRRQRIRGR